MAEDTARQGALFDDAPGDEQVVQVSARCVLRTREGRRVVVVAGVPLLHYGVGDRMSEAHAIVQLVEGGWATQLEAARAFGVTTRTVRRMERRFEAGGLAALGRLGGYPRGRPRLPASRVRWIERQKGRGRSNRKIGSRIGVTEKAVRKVLRRLGWKETEPVQGELPLSGGADPNLSGPSDAEAPEATAERRRGDVSASSAAAGTADPNLSAPPEEPPFSLDGDPSDRSIDRICAALGVLDDAVPLFREGRRVPGAGVLLAVPAIEGTGVLDCAREIYGSIGPAFYGLRTSVVALVLFALLRIKRPEALKERSPEDLGRILGLDRAPEVKTLRRKLARLASAGCASAFGRALALRRVERHGEAMGFLYADGHVRVYHGKHVIPKAHVARMRLAAPATSDYWVNDERGEPLFVVTAKANAHLTAMLLPLLDEVRSLVGERRVTIVFDRGGWSPRLFRGVLARGFDILTYRKGWKGRVRARHFRDHAATIDGREVRYRLADRGVRLRNGPRLRQVTLLTESGHQTPIVTSRRDLSAVEVAWRLFERWRQENFFKYLREEYALDALLEHAVEADDALRDVPNPHWNEIAGQIQAARAEVMRLSAHLGLGALANPEQARRTMRGFKVAHAKEARAVVEAMDRLARLERRRASLPRRVPVRDVVAGPIVRLAAERQLLGSLFKMVAYQAECDLVRRLAPHYRRAEDEGRTLVQTALASAADIDVAPGELRVTLAPLSSPHRCRAVAALCEELNAARVRFPGTDLVMRYAVHPPPPPAIRGPDNPVGG
jgi:prepilin-type processing-associated H-X9-DG protein